LPDLVLSCISAILQNNISLAVIDSGKEQEEKRNEPQYGCGGGSMGRGMKQLVGMGMIGEWEW
jgi:hypothetical protein